MRCTPVSSSSISPTSLRYTAVSRATSASLSASRSRNALTHSWTAQRVRSTRCSRSAPHARVVRSWRSARLACIAATPSRRRAMPTPPGPASVRLRTSASPSPKKDGWNVGSSGALSCNLRAGDSALDTGGTARLRSRRCSAFTSWKCWVTEAIGACRPEPVRLSNPVMFPNKDLQGVKTKSEYLIPTLSPSTLPPLLSCVLKPT
mmetsp:Transcript_1993/g.4628  ORF Transcript_1993/g.4628 Transcript_1993/m.4628 type:complete len:205 (+) Transcript_1993:4145-4759(+)